jgi:mannan endo-1,4-beta-mannosidase
MRLNISQPARAVYKSLAMMAAICAAGCAPAEVADAAAKKDGFVRVVDGRFDLDGSPYVFVGVNMWYAAYLGAPAAYGDRERLIAELDLLQSLGVDNLRILGASERSPFKLSLEETFRDETGEYNEALLQGLDFALAEIAKRDMRAVIYLNNFWEWSGGMGTYLYWTNGGTFVDLGDPAHPWPAYPNFTAQFYESGAASALYRDYVRAVVARVNSVTGVPYTDDPAIMAWQLANEPRPGFDFREGEAGLQAFYDWIGDTARFIKALDPNHLVSSGNEGFMGCNEIESCFPDAHKAEAIDYLTFHVWPRNWSWFDAAAPAETFPATLQKTEAYIDRHVAYAKDLGKPIVLEEFGFDRDGAANAPEAPVAFRNDYLSLVYGQVEDSVDAGGPFMGTNLWAWGGYGRAQHEDFAWRRGDTSFTGDPPQEPQGRNSVFASDVSTLALIKAHAEELN